MFPYALCSACYSTLIYLYYDKTVLIVDHGDYRFSYLVAYHTITITCLSLLRG